MTRCITIMAIYADSSMNWFVGGWTRETADENYGAAASFYPKPLYRIVVQRRRRA